jgi:hypothetical protein
MRRDPGSQLRFEMAAQRRVQRARVGPTTRQSGAAQIGFVVG